MRGRMISPFHLSLTGQKLSPGSSKGAPSHRKDLLTQTPMSWSSSRKPLNFQLVQSDYKRSAVVRRTFSPRSAAALIRNRIFKPHLFLPPHQPVQLPANRFKLGHDRGNHHISAAHSSSNREKKKEKKRGGASRDPESSTSDPSRQRGEVETMPHCVSRRKRL